MSFDSLPQMAQDFWALVVDVWNNGILGADVGSLMLALFILLLSWVLRRVFSVWVIGLLRRQVAQTETKLDDAILAAIAGPLKFIFVIVGIFAAAEVMDLSPDWETRADLLVSSLLIVALFWALFNAVGPFIRTLGKTVPLLQGAIADWVERGLKVVLVLLALASVLEYWGIPVAPIIGGLGLFGVAVALGAQDLFKNLIAGVLILTERRFRKGDWIKVDGVVEGTVETIGFRSTRVRQFDKAPVQVPNAQLSDNPVTNFSAMTFRRISWTIGVTYSTSIDQLRQIRDELEEYLLTSGDFARPDEAATFVRIASFGASSIDIMLYCFTRTTKWGEWLEVRERLAYRVMEVVEGAGADFAFPSQSLYVEQFPGERPDVFIPPTASGSTADPAQISGAAKREKAQTKKPPAAKPAPTA